VAPEPSPAAPDAEPEPGAQAAAEQDQPQSGKSTPDSGAKKRKRPFWRDLIVIVIAALALTILLKAFVVQVFSIPSGSMENTLLPGDRILVSKIVYRFRPIERGDIVVFSGAGSWDLATPPPSNEFVRLWDDVTNLVGISAPGTDYVKRVVGLPGDRVACCTNGKVTVNGVALDETSYIYPGDQPSAVRFSEVVPAGRLWVMGDNRADSDDSRYRSSAPFDGTIPESAVVGRAFVIIWPLSRIGDLPIPNTFKQAALNTAAAAAMAPPAALGGAAVVAASGVLVWRRRRGDRA
jgi:signal peptidase I